MRKPPHVWVATSQATHVVLPAGVAPGIPRRSVVPFHLSRCTQGAELAGPWLLRAAVRVPRGEAFAAAGLEGTRWLGALHVRWLHRLGVQSAGLYEGPEVVHWASFAARRRNDVVVGSRKITSIAATPRAHDTLIVADTLVEPAPWLLLCRALGRREQEAALLDARSVAVSARAGPGAPDVWAAHLRGRLHLALALSELQDGVPSH